MRRYVVLVFIAVNFSLLMLLGFFLIVRFSCIIVFVFRFAFFRRISSNSLRVFVSIHFQSLLLHHFDFLLASLSFLLFVSYSCRFPVLRFFSFLIGFSRFFPFFLVSARTALFLIASSYRL